MISHLKLSVVLLINQHIQYYIYQDKNSILYYGWKGFHSPMKKYAVAIHCNLRDQISHGPKLLNPLESFYCDNVYIVI